MKKTRNNIFFNVVKSEDQTTELLRNFLQFKIFRDNFLNFFLENNKLINSIEDDHLETQVFLSNNNGRPDLIIANEKIKILIEVKINNVDLTENQPEGYFNHLLSLDKNIEKWLVFLVPNDYINEKDIDCKIKKLRATSNQIDIHTKILYWQDIIDIIDKKELTEISAYIAEFYDLLKSWFTSEIIIFDREEVYSMFSKDIPERLLKLFRIVDYVKKSNSRIYSVRAVKDEEEYGIYFKDSDNKTFLFFGIWYDFWKKYSKPLCYGIDLKKYDKKVKEKFTQLFDGKYEDFEDWRATWIDEKAFFAKNTAELIAKQIEDVLNQLSPQ